MPSLKAIQQKPNRSPNLALCRINETPILLGKVLLKGQGFFMRVFLGYLKHRANTNTIPITSSQDRSTEPMIKVDLRVPLSIVKDALPAV